MSNRATIHKRPFLTLLILFAALMAAAWRVTPAHAASPLGSQAAGPLAVRSSDDDGDKVTKTGTLSALPAGGGQGTYTVDGVNYTADADTEFETENGPLATGACVEVTVETATPTVAEKFETLPAGACTGDDGDDDGDDDNGGDNDGDDDGDDDEIEFYGRIVTMPAGGLQGTWVVGDRTFTTDADTEFEQEHGGFLVGACVEVEADEATPTVAEKIETESDYKCNGSDDDDDGKQEFEGKLFGEITALPATPDLLGEWTVGTFTFVVTETTRLDEDDDGGMFAVGALVKVEFVVDNGRTIATEVELVYERHDDDDNGGDDRHEGRLGHAWGSIVTFPEDLVGTWDVSGVQYQVNEQTRLKQENGPFAVGAQVKVKFFVADDGSLVAWEIKTTNKRGGMEDDNEFKFVGFVETAPQGSLTGEWTIGGETFITNAATVFKEDDGLLVKGAYVEVEYRVEGGQRIVTELEAENPPDSGDDDSAGKIEQGGDDSSDDNSLAAAAAINATPGSEVWRISGRDYVVNPSTELNSNAGPLTLGATVLVNSYTNAQGQQVATRIASINFTSFQYLPLSVRK